MIEFLVLQIKMGRIIIDKIPLKYREEVRAVINAKSEELLSE